MSGTKPKSSVEILAERLAREHGRLNGLPDEMIEARAKCSMACIDGDGKIVAGPFGTKRDFLEILESYTDAEVEELLAKSEE